MPDNQPPADEQSNLDQAEPYRTPVSVSDGSTKAAAMKSPILWIAVLTTTVAAAAGAAVFLLQPVRDFNDGRRPVKPIKEHVEEFGIYRTPIEDIEGFEEVEILPTEAPDPISNESGEIPLP